MVRHNTESNSRYITALLFAWPLTTLDITEFRNYRRYGKSARLFCCEQIRCYRLCGRVLMGHQYWSKPLCKIIDNGLAKWIIYSRHRLIAAGLTVENHGRYFWNRQKRRPDRRCAAFYRGGRVHYEAIGDVDHC